MSPTDNLGGRRSRLRLEHLASLGASPNPPVQYVPNEEHLNTSSLSIRWNSLTWSYRKTASPHFKVRLSTLLAWADIAGGCTTRRYSKGLALTASIDFVRFHHFPTVSAMVHIQTEVVVAEGRCMEVAFVFVEENLEGECTIFGHASALYVSSTATIVPTKGIFDLEKKVYRKTFFTPTFAYSAIKKEWFTLPEHANTQGCCSGMQALTWALTESEEVQEVGKISFIRPIALGSVVTGKYYPNGSQLVDRDGVVAVTVDLTPLILHQKSQ